MLRRLARGAPSGAAPPSECLAATGSRSTRCGLSTICLDAHCRRSPTHSPPSSARSACRIAYGCLRPRPNSAGSASTLCSCACRPRATRFLAASAPSTAPSRWRTTRRCSRESVARASSGSRARGPALRVRVEAVRDAFEDDDALSRARKLRGECGALWDTCCAATRRVTELRLGSARRARLRRERRAAEHPARAAGRAAEGRVGRAARDAGNPHDAQRGLRRARRGGRPPRGGDARRRRAAARGRARGRLRGGALLAARAALVDAALERRRRARRGRAGGVDGLRRAAARGGGALAAKERVAPGGSEPALPRERGWVTHHITTITARASPPSA